MTPTPAAALDRIEALFDRHGRRRYDARHCGAVSALQHALQCAQLAEWAHADNALVAAALLHDLGHFIEAEAGVSLSDDEGLDAAADDGHERLALPLLEVAFDAAVTEPIRLHVQAKRYLVSVDRGYAAALSPASTQTLRQQGGAMTAPEMRAFERLPHADAALTLRRWDDMARHPGQATPPLRHYLALLQDVMRRPARPRRPTETALAVCLDA
jgi:phosphonate degradation associated HDIG domain protein